MAKRKNNNLEGFVNIENSYVYRLRFMAKIEI
jgi:hypothetical protein